MSLWERFSVVGLCQTLLSTSLSLSLEVVGTASGSGHLRLVCHPSRIGSSSFRGVLELLPEMGSCISLWRLPIVGGVSESVSLLGEVFGSCCTVGVVVDSSFCSLQRGYPPVHRVFVGIYPGLAPVVMRGLAFSACWRRFVPFSLATLGAFGDVNAH